MEQNERLPNHADGLIHGHAGAHSQRHDPRGTTNPNARAYMATYRPRVCAEPQVARRG